MADELSGVFAAALTPLDGAGRPDAKRFVEHCAALLEQGCDGINVLGTTGEANSIGLEDRIALMRAVGESSLPVKRFMVGTGTCALEDTVRLTREAAEAGFSGALILPPFYYKGISDDGLYEFFARTIGRVAPQRMKIYLYNFPAMTGIQFSPDLIGRLRAAFGPLLAGLKDSSSNVAYERELAERFPGFAVFPGSEAYLADAKRWGFAGCISATTNLTQREAHAVWHAASEAEADRHQVELTRLRNAFSGYPTVPAVRSVLAAATKDPSWERMLPPLVPLTPEQARALSEALHGWPVATPA